MRYITAFFISLVAFFVLGYFNLNNIFTIVFVVLLILVILLAPMLYTTLWQTDVDKLERFLLKNKKDPNFYIIYALANKLDDKVEDLTETLLHKYKQGSRHASYRVVRALYFENLQEAKEHVTHINHSEYSLYYQSSILMEEGDLDKAEALAEQIKTRWKKYALLAELERKRDNIESAKNHALQARTSSRGLQRYVLHKTYERDFGL